MITTQHAWIPRLARKVAHEAMQSTGEHEMNIEELRKAMDAYEDLEYQFTGGETNFERTGIVPGWYPCTVYAIKPSGNIEIGVRTPKYIALEVTVLKRNIPIAFRRKQEAVR